MKATNLDWSKPVTSLQVPVTGNRSNTGRHHPHRQAGPRSRAHFCWKHTANSCQATRGMFFWPHRSPVHILDPYMELTSSNKGATTRKRSELHSSCTLWKRGHWKRTTEKEHIQRSSGSLFSSTLHRHGLMYKWLRKTLDKMRSSVISANYNRVG